MAVEQLITNNIDLWTSAIKKKSATGRGSSEKIELYGIKKLRELILELAVRGKLVPQEPTDEPANELLKRIEAEKAQLIKDKKIKKTKKLPEILDSEIPFSIPSSWNFLHLADSYYSISPSGKKLKTSEISEKGRFPVVDQGQEYISGYSDQESLVINIPSEVIIFGDHTRNIKHVDFDFIAGADGTKILCPLLVNSKYFYLVLNSYDLDSRGYGRHFKILNANLIPIPPIEEQQRIVDKVDELMALCDQLESQAKDTLKAHEILVQVLLTTLTDSKNAEELNQNWQRVSEHFDTLFTTEQSIDQLKQTILQLAVMGKLVPQNPNDAPASVLLEKIAEEKAQLIKDKKIKKQKSLPPISDEEKPFELPKGWEWTRLGNTSISRLGKMLDKGKNKGNLLPYVRNTNVQWNCFELEDVKLMRIEDSEKDEFRLKKGDLLICEGGEPGRCAIWQNETVEMYFQKALHRVRPLGSILPNYLMSILMVDANSKSLDKYFTGATIKHFVGAKLNAYVIPLAPINEQHRIVTKVEELIALCDQLKTNISNAQTTQLNLTDVIIDQ